MGTKITSSRFDPEYELTKPNLKRNSAIGSEHLRRLTPYGEGVSEAGTTQGSTDPALGAARTEAMRRIEANGARAGHLAISQWTDLQPRVPDHRRLADRDYTEGTSLYWNQR